MHNRKAVRERDLLYYLPHLRCRCRLAITNSDDNDGRVETRQRSNEPFAEDERPIRVALRRAKVPGREPSGNDANAIQDGEAGKPRRGQNREYARRSSRRVTGGHL